MQAPASSFDLHVLSTPPAFVLSQDQTLQKKQTKNSPSKKSQKNLTNTVLIKSENRKNTNKKAPQKKGTKKRVNKKQNAIEIKTNKPTRARFPSHRGTRF